MFKTIVRMQIAIIVLVACAWVANLVKLTDCDFEAPYKCEVIHGAGLLGPVAIGTVWVGTDAEE